MAQRSNPDSDTAWRTVITVEYPANWDFWNLEWGTPPRGPEARTEVSHYGPYLSRGPAKAAVKNKLRELEMHYRYETVYRKRGIEPAHLTARLESTPLTWELLQIEKTHDDSQPG